MHRRFELRVESLATDFRVHIRENCLEKTSRASLRNMISRSYSCSTSKCWVPWIIDSFVNFLILILNPCICINTNRLERNKNTIHYETENFYLWKWRSHFYQQMFCLPAKLIKSEFVKLLLWAQISCFISEHFQI